MVSKPLFQICDCFELMVGSGDHLKATTAQPTGSTPTREEFANLQQQINQLCARLEEVDIFGAPNSTISGQTR